MTTFQTIASGSGGNAALLTAGDARILLDMGISCRKLCAALARAGTRPAELDAVFISHEHSPPGSWPTGWRGWRSSSGLSPWGRLRTWGRAK